MVVSLVLLKIAAHSHFACHRAASKLRSYGFLHKTCPRLHQVQQSAAACPTVSSCSLEGREGQSLVCDFHGALLRTKSPFPYFMLMAFEGGGLLRALLLLLLSPLLWLLGAHRGITIRIMIFVTFCGLRAKKADLVCRAVLPKFYLQNLHRQAFELFAAAATGKRVVVTDMPRLMAEGFLREYLGVSEVAGAELQVARGGRRFTGLISSSALFAKQRTLMSQFGDAMADVALVSPSTAHDHLLCTYSKEVYVINEEESPTSKTELPRNKYPKPLIFHDGRLAFLPTPSATLAFFLWLPMAVPLAVFRIIMGLFFPYKVTMLVGAFTGIRFRVSGLCSVAPTRKKGTLYVCSHRTLLDPIVLSTALQRPVPAVTYSLSRISELIAPLRTVRLTRDRARDAVTMRRLLAEGDLAVCPEGTTCREPYLLRFSPLFAELAEEMVPVAMDARVRMLYGTTASGHKWLDPVAFMMDPTPSYEVRILGPVQAESPRAEGRTAVEVANEVQRRLAEALGFECTSLTRRDKYLMLAGNEGLVRDNKC